MTIPLSAALLLLEKAHDITVVMHPTTVAFSLDVDAEQFLSFAADDGDYEFWFQFSKANNAEVAVTADSMTLLADPDEANSGTHEVTLRLLAPMLMLPPAPPLTPPLMLKALRHVRAHIPDVDRVVVWADGRWAFMTDDHAVPSFAGHLVDVGLLEDAIDELSGGIPHAFQLHTEHQ